MNKNKKIGLIVVGIIVLVGAFYGGMVYGGNNVRAGIMSRSGGNFAGRNGNFSAGSMRTVGMGGFTTGQIISKDDKSITVSLIGGGSKIIFLDSATKISKSTEGTTADLTTGTQVSVMGSSNADGSINATTVQIRPSTTPMVK